MVSDCPDSVNNDARQGKPSFRLSGTDQIAWGDPADDSRRAPAVAGNKAEGRAKREAQPTALSIRSNSSAPPSKADPKATRRHAYALRSGHRRIIDDLHKPVALCGLTPRRGPGGEPLQATLAVADGQAGVNGLMRCANPWSCPCCAPKLAAKRAAILGPQVTGRLSAGWTAWLITFTISHGPTDTLADLLAAIGQAWSRVTSGRGWAKLREAGELEYVRGYDVTYSYVRGKGWHPHIHAVLLLGPDHANPADVADTVFERWITCSQALGLKVSRDGQEVEQTRDDRKATSYAVTPAACYEAAAMAMKRARRPDAGWTPFELLERAVAGRAARERRARRPDMEITELPPGRFELLWREYVQATKGLRQVVTSRGLTLTDDDLADDDQAQPLAELGSATLKHLDRTGRTADLLDQAEKPAADRMEQLRGIESFLTKHVCVQSYIDCDWSILWPPGSAEADRDLALREDRVRQQDAGIPYDTPLQRWRPPPAR